MEIEKGDVLDHIDFDTLEVSPEKLPCDDQFGDIEIKVGLQFSTVEEVQQLYAQYSKSKGFQIRVRNSRSKIVQFVCSKEGVAKSRSKLKVDGAVSSGQSHRYTKTSKTGCRACLYSSLDCSSNIWKITKFLDEHNHEMVSPNSHKYLRTYKNLSAFAKCLTEMFDCEGIAVSKVVNVLNSNLEDAEFSRKDCYNHITRLRKKMLDAGDAQAVHLFCIRQQEINPNFRYAIQLDDEDRMQNFFWVDTRSRSAYHIFGDVVSFDTTYKTNKYSMPFASFVSIDNHMNTMLFGCALLQDETEETFVWLFASWLHAMDGKMPLSFVTDQDAAMMNAVRRVFPMTRHKLCLWHITKKFPERLSHVYHNHSSFKNQINKCIHESLTMDEFEESWKRLVIEHNLEHNNWLRNLYEMRYKWVPLFSKDVFFGGLNTTGRSESINAFFDTFVHAGTTLREFMHKFSQALDSRYETFRWAEYDSRHKMPMLSLGMGLEEHASIVYTGEIFKLFHVELTQSIQYNRETLVERDPIRLYRVYKRVSKGYGYKVEFNMYTNNAKCECMNFSFKGILCRHILSVFFMHSVDHISSQYILYRWTKEARRVLWESPIAQERVQMDSIRQLQLRATFDDICKMCDLDDELFEFARKDIDTLHEAMKFKLHIRDGEVVGSSNPQQTQSSTK